MLKLGGHLTSVVTSTVSSTVTSVVTLTIGMAVVVTLHPHRVEITGSIPVANPHINPQTQRKPLGFPISQGGTMPRKSYAPKMPKAMKAMDMPKTPKAPMLASLVKSASKKKKC